MRAYVAKVVIGGLELDIRFKSLTDHCVQDTPVVLAVRHFVRVIITSVVHVGAV